MPKLWSILEHCVESGKETRKVDLKQRLDLSSSKSRARFAKDVAAMANTGGGRGYLVVGVVDRKHRQSNAPSEYIVGFRPENPELFDQRMSQALDHFCSPVPEARYEELIHRATGRPIGVIVIPRGYNRPYTMDGDVFVRRGSHTYPAEPNEVRNIPRRVLINFARPIEPAQKQELEQVLRAEIDEIIDVPGQLDNHQPYLPQVRAMIDAVGLTPEEWQGLPIVVNIHPFPPATAAVLAGLHGLRGYFPEVVRMRRNEETGCFEVAEVLNIQSVRDQVRDWVVQP